MKLTLNMDSLKNEREWDAAGIRLPRLISPGKSADAKGSALGPFRGRNIFRGYIAELSQRLLESGRTDTGVIAAETYDGEIIGRIFKPHDNLTPG
jgi:fructuronate reductase